MHLNRVLEIGSYQTTWAMLHRLRSVLVRPGLDRLAGRGAADETFIGGEEAGLSGGRAKGKRSSVVFRSVDISAETPGLQRRVGRDHVEPGARLIADGWPGYLGLEKLGYVHDSTPCRLSHEALAPGQTSGSSEGHAPARLCFLSTAAPLEIAAWCSIDDSSSPSATHRYAMTISS
jgi:hypothetical protein